MRRRSQTRSKGRAGCPISNPRNGEVTLAVTVG